MNRGEIRSRIRLRLGDLTEGKVSDELINEMIAEAMREMARQTLTLEAFDNSLTFVSSGVAGFTIPTDMVKVKELIWVTSNNYEVPIDVAKLDFVREKRNDWADLNDTTSQAVVPRFYVIHNGRIVLDSETQVSPALYYYKYATVLSSDASSPDFDSEYHKYFVNYAMTELTGDIQEERRWERGLKNMRGSRRKMGTGRTRYRDM